MSEQESTLDEFVGEKAGEEDSGKKNKSGTNEHSQYNVLPTNWRTEKLSEITDVVGGSTPSTSNDAYWGGGIPWATPTDITGLTSNTISETADTLTQEGLESTSTHLLPPNSVLMTSRATIGECAVNTVDMATNQGFKNFVPGEDIETWYLFYRMQQTKPFLESLGSGSTFDEVSKSVVKSVEIPVPTLPEQRKIATVLYTVDQAIEKTGQLINQYKRLKKGVSQELMKHGTRNPSLIETDSRFGQLPENWSIERLVDVTDIVGRTEPPTDVDKYWNGDIPWAKPGDIRNLNEPIISETEQTVTQAALEEVSSNLVPPGSVLLTTRATVGLCAVNEVEMTTSRAFKDLIPGDQLDTWYLYYRIAAMEDYLNRLGWGSTFTEVIKPVLENVTIPIPPLEEQREIGERLKSIDSAISKNIYMKEQYQRLKQGLMQDLLSGTVKTTDTNITVPDEVAQHG